METSKPREHEINPEFRDLPAIEHWSASFSLAGLSNEEFESAVREAVEGSGQNFMGFKIIPDNSYVRTRYPRKKYGVLEIDECRAGAEILAKKLGVQVIENEKSEQSKFRVVLGLVEGYGVENTIHSIAEVQTQLGQDFTVQEGEVYSAGHLFGPDYSVYREPSVIIEGSMDQIKKVYELADKFKQERFTIDDFGSMQSHIVETRYCKKPE